MGGHKFDQSVLKTQLKLAISRIKLQKQKKDNNIKNQKREIAELLKAGKDESARIKVEGVIRDDFIIEAFDILELFCELVLARLGVIQISKDCPPDLVEAVCTLIYSGPRTDVKELLIIREQLAAKFSKEFALNAMSNKDNCVNARVVHKLSIQTPENYLVYQYLNEIARGANLQELEPPHHIEPPRVVEPIHMENFGHPVVMPPSDGNVVAKGPPSPIMNQFPSFPQPPTSNAVLPVFPQPPMGNQMPTYSTNFPPSQPQQSPPPSQHSVQSNGQSSDGFPDIPIPTFNSNNFNTLRFPAPPKPTFPTNTSPNNTGPQNAGIPEFPSVPNFSSNGNSKTPSPSPSVDNEIPTFPSVPSNNNTMRFPTPPSDFNFPTPPPSSTSNNTILEFPTPPASDNIGSRDSAVPDFDDLTARFEKLKKRDL